MNLLGYVQSFGNKSFKEMPFSETDAVVISQLSYFDWEKAYPENFDLSKPLKIREIKSNKTLEALTRQTLNPNEGIRLIKAMNASRRYKHLQVAYIRNNLDKDSAIQFYAATFLMSYEMPMISFRGTDTSLVGWREDLSLAFKEELPGQKEALDYLESVVKTFEGPFRVVGHSKGGNFAAYALYKMEEETYERLDSLYNLDGPGFLRPYKIFDQKTVATRTGKMIKLVPIDSLVGILLTQTSQYTIVDSYKILASQHNPINWKIASKTGLLMRAKTRSLLSNSFEKATKKWVEETPPDDIDLSTKYIIDFLGGYDNDVNKISENIPKTIREFEAKYKVESQDTQKMIRKTLIGLLIMWRDFTAPIFSKKPIIKKDS